jgi:DNA invertase Pin-like site-specific DNA recombinase
VGRYIEGVGGDLIQEFVEVASGRKTDRTILNQAIELCQVYNATLILKSFDRLSRDAHFLLGLQKSGIRFLASDNPQANELTVGILALVAQQEAQAISSRTKAALAAAKAKGVKLGGFRGYIGRTEDLQTATEKRIEKRIENANLKATRLKPILERVNPDGSLSLHRVAKALNQEEIPTMSGKGQWNAKSVQRVYQRLAA